MDIVFGPVYSRRFGRSLGVDLSPSVKQCNFDCVYCELQRAKSIESMKEIIAVQDIIDAVKKAIETYQNNFDVLTITANGEPTLYPHLRILVQQIRTFLPDPIKLMILTNGSLLWRKDIQETLQLFDVVKCSFDAFNAKSFKQVDRPHKSLELESIKQGIKTFAQKFKGELMAEVLFVKGINDTPEEAQAIAEFLSQLPIKRVDIGSIDRPPAYPVESVDEETLQQLAQYFDHYPHLCINLPKRLAQSQNEQDSDEKKNLSKDSLLGLIKRRPLSVNDALAMFDRQTLALIDELCQKQEISICMQGDVAFYMTI
ncbi:radical SAM protein [Helicobacter sp. MIT 05-5293]|uniref:radical SAM protein n=1 Tax=Helicobacter sp. MIT 05-5293 TaxID=1548149 RepID=UPI00051D4444|nr:radical SAM protein [Helicobacter sp. MIT 05-5293]TLD82153.1 radical SAM protein [Helicobacter sp. MIT 05-5293]